MNTTSREKLDEDVVSLVATPAEQGTRRIRDGVSPHMVIDLLIESERRQTMATVAAGLLRTLSFNVVRGAEKDEIGGMVARLEQMSERWYREDGEVNGGS